MHRLLALLLVSPLTVACTTHVVRSASVPTPTAQFRLATLNRVWVAGFATEHKPEFDLNRETVRLLRDELRSWSSAQVVEAEPLSIDAERRLSDAPFWQQLGEEHGRPLIVTGSVKLHLAPAKVVHRGVRTAYAYASGRVLDATVVLIDGTTGEVISTSKLPSRTRYGAERASNGLTLFMQMMQAGMSDWFDAIGSTPPAAPVVTN